MATNMKVFEYKQLEQLSIESISHSVYDIVNTLSSMKTDLSDFFEKSKVDPNLDDVGGE